MTDKISFGVQAEEILKKIVDLDIILKFDGKKAAAKFYEENLEADFPVSLTPKK